MAKKSENPLLKQAQRYHGLGLCVIPIPCGMKAARIRWGKYQKERPDESQLRKWFANNERNIAVVLGLVSSDLVCRDFDTMAEYEKWSKAYPDLAKTLPTVRTSKGMHVYFQARVETIKHTRNGELRGKGGYCLLPPSTHPDGHVYQWVNPLTTGNILAIEPELAGFLPENPNVTEQTEQSEQTEAIVGEGIVEKAIAETLPQEVGTRNRKVFEFARALKSLPQFADARPNQLREIVETWQARALPNIRTKEFEETWIDFLKAWPRIRYTKGKEPMTQIFEKAIQLEPPHIADEKYPNHSKLKIMVSLCRELQRAAGDSPFFLSVRTAGKLLNVSPMQVSRWFFLLETDGILKVVAKGGTAQTVRTATRFRYLAN
jgi:hypothetical protein